jgi:alpha-glucosidase
MTRRHATHATPRRALHGLLARAMAATLVLFTATSAAATPTVAEDNSAARVTDGTLEITRGADQLSIRFVAAGLVHLHYRPAGRSSEPSLVIDRAAPAAPFNAVRVTERADTITLATDQATLRWDRRSGELRIENAQHHLLLQQRPGELKTGMLTLQHAARDPLYGIGGYIASQRNVSGGLLRHGSLPIKAGEQGYAGAPLVWSTTGYGLLVDTIGGRFNLDGSRLSVRGNARPDLDYYLLIGTPAQIFADVASISGRTPLFPKWAMGFTNSQWGSDQKELLQIIDTYRAKHIPIDNFTLDFDWKAWGQDWGEFRWNTQTFPGGPDGQLKKELDARGMHLTGIMKPRVHVDTVEGRYATAHGFWSSASKVAPDYFSKLPIRELDFDQPAVRAWFFNDHLKHSFDTGMIGWWNDEADDIGSDTQFTNMQRALYDGQRGYSPLRVWSINRNFYLGAQRYAYGMWSGDIPTGFASMAGQRARMLSAIDVGAMQWGMDGGGFKHGTPTPENYARWIEFGAFTPIFRVHGDFGQKRQPWVYGPVAEKAATDAIRLRYALIPYIYSYEDARRRAGVGLVRPLLFDWPHDPQVRNDVDAWMFGNALLVAPVVQQGQTSKTIYVPAGRWTDWFSGKVYPGGQTITLAVDSKGWGDIPLFVREGAIIPTQSVMDYVDQHPVTQLTVEMFPAAQRSTFDYYDDDGSTYNYEHGAYFRQSLAVQRSGETVRVETGAVEGSYTPPLKFYLLKIHGGAASAVNGGSTVLPHLPSLDDLEHSTGEGWASGTDRFGAVTWVRVTAAQARTLALASGHPRM